MSIRYFVAFFGILLLGSYPGRSAVTDLRITEVDPLGDWVEITHFSDMAFVNGATRGFCKRINYANSINIGESFGARESKTFNISLHDTLSDVWLYVGTAGFGIAANMITGMKYGGSAQTGRESVAVTAFLWPSTSDFIPLPDAGETMQLIGDDPSDPASWKSLPPTPGQYFVINNPLPNLSQSPITVGLQKIATGLVSPLGVRSPGDGSTRLFIFDQAGEIHIYQNGAVLGTLFADLSGQLVSLSSGFDERGLLGLAFHPEFSLNRKLYTYTSEPNAGPADFSNPISGSHNHQTVITEWLAGVDNPNELDMGSEHEILRVDQPQANHNGGDIAFGPDGLLYIAIGDGGSGNDQGNGHSALGNAQDTLNVLGTILRIDVEGTNSSNGKYGVPDTNPFMNDVTKIDEIYAYGFRNPYRMSFDALTGDLYSGDVGQRDIEELNLITSGGNYGWRAKEGCYFFDAGVTEISGHPVDPVTADLIDPIAQYDRGDGISIIGGYVYRGAAIPGLAGRYVFGEYAGTSRRLLVLTGNGNIERLTIGNDNRGLSLRIKGFGQDAGGEVYFCVSATGGPTGTSGVVYKIIPLIGLNDIDIAGADAVLEVVRDSSVSGVSVEASTDPADPASWSGKAASVVSVQPGVDEARVTRNGGSENYRVRGP